MNAITKKFMNSTKIPNTHDNMVEKIMDFLSDPGSVAAMIAMSEIGQPALAGVAKRLEENFANSSFPLHHDAPNKNAPNRRNVGWMVKFVMREFCYMPLREGDMKPQPRIGKASRAKYFSTAAVYKKTNNTPNYRLNITIVKN